MKRSITYLKQVMLYDSIRAQRLHRVRPFRGLLPGYIHCKIFRQAYIAD